MRPIQKPISSLPDYFGIGVKMTSEYIFFTLGFWVELPQILGLGFSVRSSQSPPGVSTASIRIPSSLVANQGCYKVEIFNFPDISMTNP